MPRNEGRHWGVGCLLVMAALQMTGIAHVDRTAMHDEHEFLKVVMNGTASYGYVVAGILFAYPLPVIFAILTDTMIGKYKMIFIGLSMKLLASCITLGAVSLAKFSRDYTDSSWKIFMARLGFAFSAIIYTLGMACLGVSTVPLLMEQLKQTPAAIASGARWFLSAFTTGFIFSAVIEYFLEKFYIEGHAVEDWAMYCLVRHIIMVSSDACSLAVLLFGKPKYVLGTCEEGMKSWKELMRIVRTAALLSRFLIRPLATDGSTLGSYEEILVLLKRKRLIARLKFKRGFLMIAILSVMALVQTTIYMRSRLLRVHTPITKWKPFWLGFLVEQTDLLVTLVLLLIFEIFVKKLRCSLWQETTTNQLRLAGIGALLGAVSVSLAGGYWTAVTRYGFDNVSVFWFLPQVILIGATQSVLYIALIPFCYMESPRGLTTLNISLLISLFIITPITDFVVRMKNGENGKGSDIALYSLAGATVLALIFIYLPSCMSYLRTKEEIEALEAEDEQETLGDETLEDQSGETSRLLSDLSTDTNPSVTVVGNYYANIIGRSSVNYDQDSLSELWLPGEERVA